MKPLLGTFVEIGARGPMAEEAVSAGLDSLEKAHALWSIHDPGSELSRLNRTTGERVPLSPSTLRLLRAAKAMMRLSAGAFDFTVGRLLADWGHLPAVPGAPLPRGREEDLLLGAGWGCLVRPLHLTLDGMAKGFAVDMGISAMRRSGADAAWINAGGDLRVQGDMALPVHRRELDGGMTSLGLLRNAAVASSAVRSGPQADRHTWPGVIVGRRGEPHPGMWTVMARTAWRADALTKVAANTASDRRAEAVARLGGHLVTLSHEIELVPG